MRVARALLALASCALNAGCVAVGWGTYPIAHGAGVETHVEQTTVHTRVVAPDVTFQIDLSHYEGTMVFFGLLLPVIPFWLPPDPNQQLEVAVTVEHGAPDHWIRPSSLRLVRASGEVEPVTVEVWTLGERRSPELPVSAAERADLVYVFALRPPHESFALVADGLLRVEFTAETRWYSDVWDEP